MLETLEDADATLNILLTDFEFKTHKIVGIENFPGRLCFGREDGLHCGRKPSGAVERDDAGHSCGAGELRRDKGDG